MLQCVAVKVLLRVVCVAVRVVQRVAVCCSVLQSPLQSPIACSVCCSACCSVLQCVAACCSVWYIAVSTVKVRLCVVCWQCVLQRVTVCCSVLQCVAVRVAVRVAAWCSMLQCVAVSTVKARLRASCRVLQGEAVCCSVCCSALQRDAIYLLMCLLRIFVYLCKGTKCKVRQIFTNAKLHKYSQMQR